MFVTNLTLNSVTAINTATSHTTTVHGAPPAMNGPLGIAIAPDGDTAYVTNSNANTVTPIDLKSLDVLTRGTDSRGEWSGRDRHHARTVRPPT